MNSYSIESQQNGNKLQENSKIADIYQRMLIGDKLALGNLQKVKTHGQKEFYQKKFKANKNYETQLYKINETDTKRDDQNSNQYVTPRPPYISHQVPQNQGQANQLPNISSETAEQEDKQIQKLRSYIKKKVNQLRNEKQIFKSQQKKQVGQIKKISEKLNNLKIGTINESKSYNLVRKKQNIDKMQSPKTQTTPKIQQAKKSIQANRTRNNLKKVQSSSQHKTNNHLPPLMQNKKMPTQSSQRSHKVKQSRIASRKEISTPINIADSNFRVQLQPSLVSQKSIGLRLKQSRNLGTDQFKPLKIKHLEKSRSAKISLPEIKKQKEQFANINEHQKVAQLQLIQYHQQTKKVIQQTKTKHNLNFKNQNRLIQLKKQLNVELVLKDPQIKTNALISQKDGQISPNQKKKGISQVIQKKVNEIYEDINLIEDLLDKKTRQIKGIDEKLQRNLFIQYWQEHDLQTPQFEDNSQSQYQQDSQCQNISLSNLNEAYSTSMPDTKDRKWKSKVIKQYDTNRSLQQYTKSRSTAKPISLHKKSLNQIQEGDQLQQSTQNRITVNSRLKKLLLL